MIIERASFDYLDSNKNDNVLVDEDDSNSNEDLPVSAENQSDKLVHPGKDNEDIGTTITMSDRINWPHDHARYFLETDDFQEGNQDEKSRRMRPYYFDDEDMEKKMSDVTHRRDSYSTEDAQVAEMSCRELTNQVERRDNTDQL